MPVGRPVPASYAIEPAATPVRSRRRAALGIIMTVFLIGRLVFQLFQSEFLPSPLDEILVVVIGLYAPLGIISLLKINNGLKFIAYTCAYIVVILASSLLHTYSFERGRDVFYSSLALDLKFFALFFGAYVLALRSARAGVSRRNVELIMQALIFVAFVDSFQVFRDLMGNGVGLDGTPLDIRGGFYRPNGFFHHPVASAQVALFGFIAALGFLARGVTARRLGSTAFLFLVLIIHISVKEIVVGCLCLMLFVLFYVRNNAFTKFVALLVAVAAIGSVFASPIGNEVTARISYYTGDEGTDTVRRALYHGSFEIAGEMMPIGSGTGTFGSQGSRTNGYSSLYFTHGVYGLWGATYKNDSFLLDTFWPKIIAETGVLGLLFFVLTIGILIRAALRLVLKTRTPEDFVLFSGMVGILVISVATAALGEEFLGSLFYVFGALALARASVLMPRSTKRRRNRRAHSVEGAARPLAAS